MRRGLVAPLIKLVIFALITIFATSMLAFTIANASGTGGTKFSARFTDVTSLNPGDEVRIAGVKVGQVSEITVVDHNQAEVEFALTNRNYLPASTIASIRYRNLVGQRYIALQQGPGEQGRKLSAGATLDLDHTNEAVNLTALFGGFKPLFKELTADDVNKLSFQIIQVFQGEAGTIGDLVRSTASLTNTIADKDKVIGEVITNLNTVLSTINQRAKNFDALIVNTEMLVTGLSADRGAIGDAVTSLGSLTEATADLLEPTRPAIQGSIAALNELTGHINERTDDVNKLFERFPIKLEKLGRAGSYGAWFNFYLCGLDIIAGPGKAPQLNLPTGLPTVNQPLYTNAASRCWAEGSQR
ncbi:MAG: MCE family protein [Mycobacteriaceae bacterium]